MDNRSVPMVQNQNSILKIKLVQLKLQELILNSPIILELLTNLVISNRECAGM